MESPEKFRITPAQWWVIALIIACIAGSVLYRYLMHMQYGHTAAMFIGIPAVLAVTLALTPKAKTATGGIIKGLTLALLVIAPLLGEGYLCILIAAPLFYAVGLLIGIPVDVMRKRDRDRQTLSCIVLLLVPMSFEGLLPQFTVDRRQTVEACRVIDASAEQVQAALNQSPNISVGLQGLLRIGFPHPMKATGVGLDPGAERAILFSGAEGDPPGYLRMRLTEHRPGFVRFETVDDFSKLTQWIRWDASEVRWTPLDAKHTRVSWRIEFDRQLDPAWYFAPWERVVVREAADYLIEANAAPAGARE